MKKFDWNEPITKKEWGILYLIVITIYGLTLAWWYWTEIKNWCGKVSKKLRNKFTKRKF